MSPARPSDRLGGPSSLLWRESVHELRAKQIEAPTWLAAAIRSPRSTGRATATCWSPWRRAFAASMRDRGSGVHLSPPHSDGRWLGSCPFLGRGMPEAAPQRAVRRCVWRDAGRVRWTGAGGGALGLPGCARAMAGAPRAARPWRSAPVCPRGRVGRAVVRPRAASARRPVGRAVAGAGRRRPRHRGARRGTIWRSSQRRAAGPCLVEVHGLQQSIGRRLGGSCSACCGFGTGRTTASRWTTWCVLASPSAPTTASLPGSSAVWAQPGIGGVRGNSSRVGVVVALRGG